MRTLSRLLAGSLLAGLVAGCAGVVPQSVGSVTVDNSFSTGGGTWSTGGRTLVAAKLVDSAGQVAVCGAWTHFGNPAQPDTIIDTVLSLGQIRSNGETLLHHFNFMKSAVPNRRLGGAQANCVLTGKPWHPVYASSGAEIVMFNHDPRPGQFFLGGEDGLEPSPRFRPAPLPNVI